MLEMFRAEHAVNMKNVRQVEASMSLRVDVALNYEKMGPAWTLSHEGEPYCCSGFLPLWHGVVECWMLTSEEAENHKFAMYRGLRLLFQDEVKRLDLHRVQCSVLVENDTSRAWLERLGFEYEGHMKAYDDQARDYVRYAWVKRELH